MRVPYGRLRRAEREMLARFPHATRTHANWTPTSHTEIHVEVWAGKSARVLPWEPQRTK